MKKLHSSISIIIVAVLAVLSVWACTNDEVVVQSDYMRRLILVGDGYIQGKSGEVIENTNTNGVWNFATSFTNIGDARVTGVTKTMVFDFGNDTFGDQWVPARADSDIGIRLSGDFILDSVSVLSTFGAGDTAIVRIYKTTAVATLISGPDTLVSGSAGYQTIDLTGVAAATRDLDVSAAEYPAIQVDEHGTLEQVSVVVHGREYDAR